MLLNYNHPNDSQHHQPLQSLNVDFLHPLEVKNIYFMYIDTNQYIWGLENSGT